MQFNHFESKPKWIWVIVTAVVSVAMMGGSFFLTDKAFDAKYVDLGQLILSIVLFLAGLFFLATMPYHYPKINVEGSIVTIKSLFLNKSFLLEEIISYEAEAKSGEYGLYNWEELTVYWGTQKIELNSWSFANFRALKEILIKGKKEGKPFQLNKKKSYVAFILVVITFGSAIAWMMSFLINPDSYLINKNELSAVYGTLKMRPEIENDGKNASRIDVQLLEYPDFTFKLQSKRFEATNVSKFIHDVQENDTISIAINKAVFNRKIQQTEPLNFWDKHFQYGLIDIYGLGFKDNQYLSIEDHNQLEKDEAAWLKYAVIAMSLLFLYLIYAQWKSDTEAPQYLDKKKPQ
jgi:hypothetical protein